MNLSSVILNDARTYAKDEIGARPEPLERGVEVVAERERINQIGFYRESCHVWFRNTTETATYKCAFHDDVSQ